jgi:hypothetical protein
VLLVKNVSLDASLKSGTGRFTMDLLVSGTFFKGDKYTRLNATTKKTDPGFPKAISGAW